MESAGEGYVPSLVLEEVSRAGRREKSYANLVIYTPVQSVKEKKPSVNKSKGGFIPSGKAGMK